MGFTPSFLSEVKQIPVFQREFALKIEFPG